MRATSKEAVIRSSSLRPCARREHADDFRGARPRCSRKTDGICRGVKGSRFTYSFAGIGTTQHLTGEYLFKAVPGLDATHVPFSRRRAGEHGGGGTAGGHGLTNACDGLAYIRQGRCGWLAVASHTRMQLLPEVPTLAECRFSRFEIGRGSRSRPREYSGARRPDPERADQPGSRQPEVIERLTTIGLDPKTLSQTEFAEYVSGEIASGGSHQCDRHHAQLNRCGPDDVSLFTYGPFFALSSRRSEEQAFDQKPGKRRRVPSEPNTSGTAIWVSFVTASLSPAPRGAAGRESL